MNLIRTISQVDGGWRFTMSPVGSSLTLSPADRAVGRLLETVVSTMPENDSQADLEVDLFHKMYSEPGYRDEKDLLPSRKINQLILKWAENNESWQSLVESTRGSLLASTSASSVLWENLIQEETLQKVLEEQKKVEAAERAAAERRRKEFEKAMRQAAKKGGQGPGGDKGDEGEGDTNSDERNEFDDDIQKHLEAAMRELEKLQDSPVTRGMMSSVTEKADEEAQDVTSALKSWGVGKGDVHPSDVKATLNMLKRSRLEKITKLVGRLKNVAARAMDEAQQSYTGTVSEAAMTNRIDRVFPTELAYMSPNANPVLRGQKIYSLVAGGGLLGWRPRSEGKTEGGFIGMFDRSGSMSGQQLDTAKAIGLAVSMALNEGERNRGLGDRYYELAFFDDGVLDKSAIKSGDSLQKHLMWATVDDGGGTNFNLALAYAVERLRLAKSNGKKGMDLLFVTDGGCSLSPVVAGMIVSAKEETNAKLIYVQIGNRSEANEDLIELAETFVVVDPNSFSRNPEGLVVQIVKSVTNHELEGYEKGGG